MRVFLGDVTTSSSEIQYAMLCYKETLLLDVKDRKIGLYLGHLIEMRLFVIFVTSSWKESVQYKNV
jgi:hypothetical protein